MADILRKRRKASYLLSLFITFVLLSACGESGESNNRSLNYGQLLAEESTGGAPNLEVYRVFEQGEFEEKWEYFKLSTTMPSVDWEESAVLFIATNESSSCPIEIETIDINSSNKAIHFQIEDISGFCNDDANPKTFVIEMERSVIEETEQIKLGAETAEIQ
ncbi:hypothetical protein [Salibacterium aidingense]|uniref:hypothetical protein n=1 Tax=Salibacterium aidingense TaxID=384933 RepID=UPI0004096F9D|nr:hypothetical protein [Salibacterium aidingense]